MGEIENTSYTKQNTHKTSKRALPVHKRRSRKSSTNRVSSMMLTFSAARFDVLLFLLVFLAFARFAGAANTEKKWL